MRDAIAALQKQIPPAPIAVVSAPMPAIESQVFDRPVLPLPLAAVQPNERVVAPSRVLRAAMPAAIKVSPIDLTTDEPIAEKSDIPAAGKFTYISQDNKPAPSKFKLIEGK